MSSSYSIVRQRWSKIFFDEIEEFPLFFVREIVEKRRHVILAGVNAMNKFVVAAGIPEIDCRQICGFQLFEPPNPPVAFTVGAVAAGTISGVIVLNFRAISRTWIHCATQPNQATHAGNEYPNDD